MKALANMGETYNPNQR